MANTHKETTEFVQPYRVGNSFAVTLRGHWSGIPEKEERETLDTYNPYSIQTFDSDLKKIIGNENYNGVYDSFYAPVDFKISGLTVRMPVPLIKDAKLTLQLKVNGGVIEKFQIPEFSDNNAKSYTVDCSFLIYEDDKIEVEVEAQDYEKLTFNDNNITVVVSGCVSYFMYKEIWSDIIVQAATTEELNTLSGLQTVDGVSLEAGDVVLVKDEELSLDNGLYVAGLGNWTRHATYSDMESLQGIIMHVEDGDVNKSDDNTNFTVMDFNEGLTTPYYRVVEPLMSWNSEDYWYKTVIHLQNRSGNEDIRDRVYFDLVKSGMDFLFQGIRLSLFRDDLMVVDRYQERIVCLYLDILVNGRSILPIANFPRPLQIDLNQKYRTYDMNVFNNEDGYPIRFGDNIDIKAYLKNPHTKYNGKLLNVQLYGCSPSCALIDSPLIAVYEPCEEEPCVWKNPIVERCEPDTTGESVYNPKVNPVSLPIPKGQNFITVDGDYVVIGGEKIYV
jgi:hypothetical protein